MDRNPLCSHLAVGKLSQSRFQAPILLTIELILTIKMRGRYILIIKRR